MLKYDKIIPFRGTNYTVALLDGHAGLIDLEGNPLTEFIYDDLSEHYYDKERKENLWDVYRKEFCQMRLNNKWGVLNDKGEVFINFEYDNEIEIRQTYNLTNFIIHLDKRNCRFYNSNTKQFVGGDFSYISETRHKDRFYFSKNKNCKGVMDENGNVIFQPNYNDKFSFWLLRQGYNSDGFVLRKNQLWGFIDFDGNIKIDFIYELLEGTRSNLFVAKLKNRKLGVINDKSEQILDFKYDKILSCNNGEDEYFITTLDDAEEFYNSKGEKIL